MNPFRDLTWKGWAVFGVVIGCFVGAVWWALNH